MTSRPVSSLLLLIAKLPFVGTLLKTITARSQLPEPPSTAADQPAAAQAPCPTPVPAPPGNTQPARRKARKPKPAANARHSANIAQTPDAPACPHCRKTMVIKVARSGANAGGQFWGCTDYPNCRGIRAIFAPLPSGRS